MNRRLRYFLWTVFLSFLVGAPRFVAAPGPAHPAVHSLARPAALAEQPAQGDSSSRELLFDWINFILLVGVLVYALRKPLAQFFTHRSSALEHALEEGRTALEAARVQLAEAEGKMRRLEKDIAALKEMAAREREAERERLRLAGEEEARRILESARAMIDSATQAARLELHSAVASEAVALAEKMIRERLDEASRARLVSRFLQAIEAGPSNRRN